VISASNPISTTKNTSAIELGITIATGLSGCGPTGIVPRHGITAATPIASQTSATQAVFLQVRMVTAGRDANRFT
jgi:hypothetical protein